MNLSILIPLLNEEESLKELYTWIIKVMQSNNYSYEIIFVDDGSTDNSWQIIEGFSNENPNVKGIRFMKNFGKSQALYKEVAQINDSVDYYLEIAIFNKEDKKSFNKAIFYQYHPFTCGIGHDVKSFGGGFDIGVWV